MGSVRDARDTYWYTRPTGGNNGDIVSGDGINPHLRREGRRPGGYLHDRQTNHLVGWFGRIKRQKTNHHLHHAWAWRPLVWSRHYSQTVPKGTTSSDAEFD